MRRALLLALAAVLLAGASFGRRSPPDGASSTLAAPLGFLRPLLAELLLLRFEVDALHGRHLHQLDDAHRILELRPDLAPRWSFFVEHFLFDVPAQETRPSARPGWRREGLALLGLALRRHPDDAHLLLTRARCLQHQVADPRSWPRPDGARVSELRGQVLEGLAAAFEAAAPDSALREVARLELSLWLEQLLVQPGTEPATRREARRRTRALLELPEVPEGTRRRLEEALRLSAARGL